MLHDWHLPCELCSDMWRPVACFSLRSPRSRTTAWCSLRFCWPSLPGRHKNAMMETYRMEPAWRPVGVCDTWASTSMARYWNMSWRSLTLRSSFRISSCRDSISFRACLVAFASFKICEPQKGPISKGKNPTELGVWANIPLRKAALSMGLHASATVTLKSVSYQICCPVRAIREVTREQTYHDMFLSDGKQLQRFHDDTSRTSTHILSENIRLAVLKHRVQFLFCHVCAGWGQNQSNSESHFHKSTGEEILRRPWTPTDGLGQESSLILSCLCILSTLRSLYLAWMVLQWPISSTNSLESMACWEKQTNLFHTSSKEDATV